MHKLTLNYIKDVDEFNETFSIFVDHVKIETGEAIVESGKHEINIEQEHIFNNKFFILSALLMVVLFFGYSTESAYLLRRWGRFAVAKCNIDVSEDETIAIRLHKQKIRFLTDKYRVEIKSEKITNFDAFEGRTFYTIFGTLFFLLFPVLIIYLLIIIFN